MRPFETYACELLEKDALLMVFFVPTTADDVELAIAVVEAEYVTAETLVGAIGVGGCIGPFVVVFIPI